MKKYIVSGATILSTLIAIMFFWDIDMGYTGSTYDLGGIQCTEGKQYRGVGEAVYSPDGKNFAYAIWNGKKASVVRDGIIGKGKYNDIQHLSYSPDGKDLYFRAAKRSPFTDTVVINGKEMPNMHSLPVYSPDGKSVTYKYGDGEYLIKDGVRIDKGEFTYITSPTYSPDGKRFAYELGKNNGDTGKSYIVLDGVRSNTGYSVISNIIFSPDSKILAYTAAVGEFMDDVIVKNGIESKIYPSINISQNIKTLVFSPDSKSSVFIASKAITKDGKDDYKRILVKDGIEIDTYDDVSNPSYSPDSRIFSFYAEKNGKRILVKDGIETTYTNLKYSPDGTSNTQVITKDGKDILIKDGIEIGKDIFISFDYYFYSPDSKSFAFVARRDDTRKMVVVKDGIASKEYNDIRFPTYSSDSKDFIFIGKNTEWDENNGKRSDKYVLVRNGKESPVYNNINLIDTPKDYLFTPDSKILKFMAQKNKKYMIVSCKTGK